MTMGRHRTSRFPRRPHRSTLEEIIQISQERRTRPSWLSFILLATSVALISTCFGYAIFIVKRKFATITMDIFKRRSDYLLLNGISSIKSAMKSILRRPSVRSARSTIQRKIAKSSPNLHAYTTSSRTLHDDNSDNDDNEEQLYYQQTSTPATKPRHLPRSHSIRL
jgi:hypothetical protein